MTETEAAIAAGAASAAAANAAAANSNPSEEQDQLHGWHLSKKEAWQGQGTPFDEGNFNAAENNRTKRRIEGIWRNY